MFVASASAFQFSTLSDGTFTVASAQDVETIDGTHFNGHAPISLDTLFLNGNTGVGHLSGPGNVDVLNFAFTVDNSQTLGDHLNQDAHWVLTSGTGAFANYAGFGSFSIDFNFVDSNSATTTTGLTGSLTAVPEPGPVAVMAIGVLAMLRRRSR